MLIYKAIFMDKKQKKQYEAPAIEVVAMENEGVIAASGGTGSSSTESYDPVPISGSAYNGASGSDLEDMINDILTVE